uniref:Uncharacterized protein n=1 Tax=Vespula pensylvanica TaxID=30213 RepID=A0A834PFM7_VESPE|nr:hypothetical protein H0235_001036 [Vespula pensylvanica]
MILLYYGNCVVPAHGQWCLLMAIDAQRCAVTINQSCFGYANSVQPGKQEQFRTILRIFVALRHKIKRLSQTSLKKACSKKDIMVWMINNHHFIYHDGGENLKRVKKFHGISVSTTSSSHYRLIENDDDSVVEPLKLKQCKAQCSRVSPSSRIGGTIYSPWLDVIAFTALSWSGGSRNRAKKNEDPKSSTSVRKKRAKRQRWEEIKNERALEEARLESVCKGMPSNSAHGQNECVAILRSEDCRLKKFPRPSLKAAGLRAGILTSESTEVRKDF